MKKLLIAGFSSLLLLSACGSDETKNTAESSNSGESSIDQVETKKELMRFYMSIPNTINKVDGELNTFEQQQEKEILPEGENLKALKEAATVSAEEAAQAVSEIEIPGSLHEQLEELQSALVLISESYKMKSSALSEEETSFNSANEKFIQADEIFNDILINYELLPSSVLNEVK